MESLSIPCRRRFAGVRFRLFSSYRGGRSQSTMRAGKLWLVALGVSSVSAFTFAAGIGVRSILRPPGVRLDRDGAGAYPRIASADPAFSPRDDLRSATLYLEVLHKLRVYYVEPLPTNSELSAGTMEALLAAVGDPNTRLLSPVEMTAIQKAASGEMTGLGVVTTVQPVPIRGGGNSNVKVITVVGVLPGTPAAAAGLQAGDRITEIDGRWIAPMRLSYRDLAQVSDGLGAQDFAPLDPSQPIPPEVAEEIRRRRPQDEADRKRITRSLDLKSAQELLCNPNGGEHELTVARGEPAVTVKVKVKLGTATVPLVVAETPRPRLGVLRIRAFGKTTADQVRTALQGFGASGVQHLVLDLRQCSGGSLEEATEVAGALLGSVRLGILRGRGRMGKSEDRALSSTSIAAPFKPKRSVVMMDRGTAGAAELLAAVLKSVGGARLIGKPTFGDGTAEEIIRLENGNGICITHARMLTPDGQLFDGKGIAPDVDASDAEPIAIRWLEDGA